MDARKEIIDSIKSNSDNLRAELGSLIDSGNALIYAENSELLDISDKIAQLQEHIESIEKRFN